MKLLKLELLEDVGNLGHVDCHCFFNPDLLDDLEDIALAAVIRDQLAELRKINQRHADALRKFAREESRLRDPAA